DAAIGAVAVETPDDGHRSVVDVNDARWRGVDARARRQYQGQHLSPRDAARIAHAREFADGEPPVLVHHRALGPQAAKRGAFALQVAQVLGRFLSALQRIAGLKDPIKLDEWRGTAAALGDGP